MAGAEDLGNFGSLKPEGFVQLAGKIHREFASTEAVVDMGNGPTKSQDQLLRQMAQFNRHLLEYLELDSAIKVGDVGS